MNKARANQPGPYVQRVVLVKSLLRTHEGAHPTPEKSDAVTAVDGATEKGRTFERKKGASLWETGGEIDCAEHCQSCAKRG